MRHVLVPDDLRYSEDHQWVRSEGHVVRVGLTHYAQDALGEITVVTLAPTQAVIGAGAELGEVEAFKAMTDLYMPVAGTVIEHNDTLVDDPRLINTDPYGTGWLCTVEPTDIATIETLLSSDDYRELVNG